MSTAAAPAVTPEWLTATVRRGVPLAEVMGIEVLAAEGGWATLRLPRSEVVLRPGDTVSGPAIMGLADVAFWAAWMGESEGKDSTLTAAMNVNFLRRTGPGPLIAEARVLKRGGTLVFGEVLIRAEDSDETAVHVTTTWAVMKPR